MFRRPRQRQKRNVLMRWQCIGVLFFSGPIMAWAQGFVESPSNWRTPSYAEVRAQVVAWLKEQPLDEPLRTKLLSAWPQETPPLDESALLELLAVTFSEVSPSAREVYQICSQSTVPLGLPRWKLLEVPPESVVDRTMRVYLARWLVQHELYDEALEVCGDLRPDEVLVPATLLFYQSVAHHKLLQKDKCLAVLARLLANQSSLPRRYRDVAQLMAADLAPLQPDTLDEVARMMDDIRRRLDLGRAGKIVRQKEDEVIAKLDKMIEELERQLQQQQQQGAGGGTLQPTQPAQDSVPLGGSGPGNVAQRDIGHGAGWGNLPPREREEALQEVTKNLPSHYRTVIEEYFRKLARTSN